jgi:hypothetical protein
MNYSSSPWDADGLTTFYATPHETDVVLFIEIRANVTDAGWDTVAFVEATWPNAKAHARIIAAAPQMLAALRAARELFYTLGDRPNQESRDCFTLYQLCDEAIAQATDADAVAIVVTTITVTVQGGMVQEVAGIPPGWKIRVEDYDHPDDTQPTWDAEKQCFVTLYEGALRPEPKSIRLSPRNKRLPPDTDGMNGNRSQWAKAALQAFMSETGVEYEDALCDLLCDLMHLSDRAPFDFEDALERARAHYAAETGAAPY